MFLDIGCGLVKQPGYIGIDKRPLPSVDIVHDIEVIPWPISDNTCRQVLCSHILEHVDPRNFINIMNEIHRICVHDAQVLIAVPYAGSVGAYQDPTHTRPGFNEITWTYFDPRKREGQNLWTIYRPAPYFIERSHWDVNGNLEVVLRVCKDRTLLRKVLELQGIPTEVPGSDW